MHKTLNVGAPSLFVTLTAWAAIVLAALVSVVSGLQHAEVASMLPQWRSLPPSSTAAWLLPAFLRFLPWALLGAALLSLLLLAAAVGLLLRLDWARRVFIALAALAIAAHLASLWLQHVVMQTMLQQMLGHSDLPARAAGAVGGLATLAQVMGVLVTLAACAVLGWIIRRLMSEPVRREFV